MTDFRIGHGYDVHRLVPNRPLIIGGVHVPHSRGLLGHSDADVLVHAIMDALLGAVGLGDIGRHFPDTYEKYRGADSLVLAVHVATMLKEREYTIVNIDSTIVAQQPRLAPYISSMCKNIASVFDIDVTRVNVKATTEEKLGFTGQLEGISAHAVVMVRQ